MVDDRHYTVQEVQKLLGCDDETILAWIHSGELLAVNISKSLNSKRPTWRIAESALRNHLSARQNFQAEIPSVKRAAKRVSK